MKLKEYKFKTKTCIVDYGERLMKVYEGDTDKIPEILLNYRIYKITVNKSIDYTHVEVY